MLKTIYESLNQLSDIGRMLVIPKTKFESSHQKASPWASKNIRGVLVPCYTGRYSPYSNFWWRRYFRGSWLSFSIIDECSVRATKLSYRKHIKLIILNLTILKTFCQNFVGCEFLRELKSSDILADVRFEGIFSIYVWSCSLYTVKTFFGIWLHGKN